MVERQNHPVRCAAVLVRQIDELRSSLFEQVCDGQLQGQDCAGYVHASQTIREQRRSVRAFNKFKSCNNLICTQNVCSSQGLLQRRSDQQQQQQQQHRWWLIESAAVCKSVRFLRTLPPVQCVRGNCVELRLSKYFIVANLNCQT